MVGTWPTTVNLGPLISGELLEQESRTFTRILIGSSTLYRYESFFLYWHVRGMNNIDILICDIDITTMGSLVKCEC